MDETKQQLTALKFGELDAAQLMAAELIIGKRGKYPSFAEIADIVNVSVRTLARWRSEKSFQSYIKERVLADTMEVLPSVMEAVTSKALSGNIKAAELVLRSLQMLNQSNTVTVTPLTADRSTDAIEQEIEELKRELGLNDNNEEDD